MANDIAQKPPHSILVGRFKAFLRQSHDDLRASSAAPTPPPTTEEIVRIYELLLSELTANVKPIITDLTIIAEQQRQHAKGIADAICDRILEVCLGCRGKFSSLCTLCKQTEPYSTGVESCPSSLLFQSSQLRTLAFVLYFFAILFLFSLWPSYIALIRENHYLPFTRASLFYPFFFLIYFNLRER